MGKGVALQFKQAYPDNTKSYEAACQRGEVVLGKMFVTLTGQLEPRLIINFPTKGHWRENSRLESIRTGLEDLVKVVRAEQIRSIAIPPLGCGLGGLRWEDVEPMILDAFAEVPEVEVLLYAPGQAIAPEDRVVNTPKRPLTDWSAAMIKIVDAYRVLGSEATHIEAQKLLYFWCATGAPLKAKFSKGQYGPYDENMRFGLQSMDGHYVIGFGDGDRLEPIRLKDGAIQEADMYLQNAPEATEAPTRIQRIIDLIDGFESPYGLELLATVHWIATQEGAKTLVEVIEQVHQWNDRKRRLMRPEHLDIAYTRLLTQGWLAP
jgi:O-acetyl-ADP-ribose deacetylase (regulator of RNase III)